MEMYDAPQSGDIRPSSQFSYDVVIVHPGAAHGIDIYGQLGAQLTAIEPPLWTRLLAGYAYDRGHSFMIIDQEAEGLSAARVASWIFALRPRLVVIAVYGHQPSASTQQMVAASALAKQIRAVSPAKILMVGGHVSALPERTLKEEAIDYACVGEGPITMVGILQGLPLGEIPGLVWRTSEGGTVVNARAALIEDLGDLHGDVWNKLSMERYRSHNWQVFGDVSRRQPYASIYTSLGCPYRCGFCMINAPFGTNRYRMRSPADVIVEIVKLYNRYQVKTFKIVDEMFILNERHYTAIAQGLVDSGIADDINIWAYARVDTVKEGHLALLRRAGFRWLALGIESGSAYVRDGASKRLKNDDIKGVVRTIQDAGIHVIANYIFGLPDDDRNSMQETLQLACDLNTEFANFYSAMAYPGSPLYTQALKEGWPLPSSWSGYSQHNSDCRPLDTKYVDAATVLRFRDEAFSIYFSRPAYQDMIGETFGDEVVKHVQEMLKYPLPRKLLEQTYAPREKVSAH
jgi:anaerobic magnesium-protoporphyrin IX monomethyl ester cyclase